TFETEEDVYAFLGYAWVEPELRENGGELAAARSGTRPKLVTLADVRGDLLQRQSEAIDELNEVVAPMRILKGIEVNVRVDGTLDVSDEDLATRDWVVASVHS